MGVLHAAIPTLPFVTASVSSMSEREAGDHTDSVAGPNLRTIGASQRFVISSDSSHHSGPAIAKAEVDSLVRSSAPVMTTVTSTVNPALIAKEKTVKPSLFSADSSSAGGANPNTGVFSDLTSSDFLVGGIRTIINPESDLQKTYFFASVRGMKHDQLFTEFNVGAARQMSLSVEVRMRAEYNVKERRRLKSVVENKDELLKARDEEIENLKAQMLLKEAEATEAIRLRVEASNFETVEKSLRDEVDALKERNTILEKDRNALDSSEEILFMELEPLLNELISPQYLSALGAAIGKAIEKDVATYNLSAEVDYIAALQRLQNVNFPLLGELRSSKDASIEAVMNILRLEEPLVDKLGLGELQPHVDQLMVPIHHSPDKVVIGATALSLALDVSSIRVQKIRENIANQ
ncbi:hypothetical protein Tco_1436705 [Tanacetum coccineum]